MLKDLGIKKFSKTNVDKERSLQIKGMSGVKVNSDPTAHKDRS